MAVSLICSITVLTISFEVAKFTGDVVLVTVRGERWPTEHIYRNLFLSKRVCVYNILFYELVVSLLGQLVHFVVKLDLQSNRGSRRRITVGDGALSASDFGL